MACIFNAFFCFSDEPLEDDPRFGNQSEWKVAMKDAPAVAGNLMCWTCFCQPCALYDLRKKALGGTLENYKCCQGYIWPMSSRAGKCGESSSPEFCLCLEVCCCEGCSISATRMLIQDNKNIRSDPCDNRIIRFQNWLQLLNCVCQIAAALTDQAWLDNAADIIQCIAFLVNCTVMGCMGAQMYYELDDSKGPYAGPGNSAPGIQDMKS